MKHATAPKALIRFLRWKPPLLSGRNGYDLIVWPLILLGFWRQDQEGGYYLDGRWTWDFWNTLHWHYVERYSANARAVGLAPMSGREIVDGLRRPSANRRTLGLRAYFAWGAFWLSLRMRLTQHRLQQEPAA